MTNCYLSSAITPVYICTVSLSVVVITISPEIYGIVSGDRLPSPRIQQGMMLLSKILQNLANHVLFKKEKHMLVFNDFLKENFERSRELVTCLFACSGGIL